jgi:hypothetical protein
MPHVSLFAARKMYLIPFISLQLNADKQNKKNLNQKNALIHSTFSLRSLHSESVDNIPDFLFFTFTSAST